MSEDEAYLKVPENVNLLLEIPPRSSSLEWNTCNREVNSVLDEIKVKNVGQTGSSCIVLSMIAEGVYRISPVDCEIDSYSIREQGLMKTSEEKLDDKAILTTVGFALPIKITLDYKQEEGRLYHSCMRIKEGRISYFGD